MQKRLITILSIILLAQAPIFAKKHHKTKSRRTHKTHHVAHKPKVVRPSVSLDDVNNSPDNIWGLDVSHYQDINWELLGQQKPKFVFIKASEGVTHQDTKYLTNYTEAKKQGILVGSYHFFSYGSSGKEQANNFLTTAQHENGDLLPVLDAEFHKKMPAKEQVTTELKDFISTIYEKLGHYPIIYCNYNYYMLYLKELLLPEQCKLWIVDYKNQPSCDWTFWQKTDRLKLQGVAGFVDFNMFNGTMQSLKNMLYKDNKENK